MAERAKREAETKRSHYLVVREPSNQYLAVASELCEAEWYDKSFEVHPVIVIRSMPAEPLSQLGHKVSRNRDHLQVGGKQYRQYVQQ